jgi:hypothetical protein
MASKVRESSERVNEVAGSSGRVRRSRLLRIRFFLAQIA